MIPSSSGSRRKGWAFVECGQRNGAPLSSVDHLERRYLEAAMGSDTCKWRRGEDNGMNFLGIEVSRSACGVCTYGRKPNDQQRNAITPQVRWKQVSRYYNR